MNAYKKRKSRRCGEGRAGQKTAILLAERINAEIALGTFTMHEKDDHERLRFDAYVEEWLTETVPREVRGTTAAKYTEVMRVHWLPLLGEIPLQDVTREQITKAVKDFRLKGKRESTIAWFLDVLKSCFGSALSDGQVSSNPAARMGRVKTKKKAEKAVDWFQIFSRTDVQEILRRAEKRGDQQGHAMILTMARTGMRISEMLGLQVGDLDFERREIAMQRPWGNTPRGPDYYGIPKSGLMRIIDMSQQLSETLQVYLRERQTQSVWVFSGKLGVPNRPNNFYYSHWNALFRMGEPLVKRHPHVLRHTYASDLLRAGQPVQYVRQQLGHSSITITVDLYGHFIPNPNKDAVDALDDPGEKIASGRKPGASNAKMGLRLVKSGGR